ncbi:MAG: SnoaL-like domain-containing protein [Pseudomonadota bacterium]
MGPSEDLKRVAKALVENCRNDRDEQNLNDLYADHAESVEAFAMPGDDRVKKGLDAIRAKHEWWRSNMEVLPSDLTPEQMAEGPFYNGDDKFSVIFRLKAKDRNSGQVMDMLETATYTVEDGKVVREEFFYAMPE